METVKVRIERDGENRIKVTRVYEEEVFFEIAEVKEGSWLEEKGYTHVLNEPWNSHGYQFCKYRNGEWFNVDIREKEVVGKLDYDPTVSLDFLKQGVFSESEYGNWVSEIPVENKLEEQEQEQKYLLKNVKESCEGKCYDCVHDGLCDTPENTDYPNGCKHFQQVQH